MNPGISGILDRKAGIRKAAEPLNPFVFPFISLYVSGLYCDNYYLLIQESEAHIYLESLMLSLKWLQPSLWHNMKQ